MEQQTDSRVATTAAIQAALEREQDNRAATERQDEGNAKIRLQRTPKNAAEREKIARCEQKGSKSSSGEPITPFGASNRQKLRSW